MSRIFCIVGKSSAGKDTLYQAILARHGSELTPVIPYTTRPRRSHETEGLSYHFVDEAQMRAFEAAGQVIEKRQYATTQGVWNYFTLRFPLEEGKDYLLITTLEGAEGLIRHYGAERVHLIYLHIDDRTRLLRYIQRESLQAQPDYAEVCRRFLADEADFSPERLSRFQNLHPISTGQPVEECVRAWEEICRATSPAGEK